ncbi:FAD-dependent oxidoreductase [Mycobacterium talmoniae]|uniref:NADH oxidase n=1 Tax=Mycobacterium talmoniae TaxID=1858794 RepID=A0A1S1NPI3_9MYCO|nr:FAD-dependent oxidoreductase [Mycobacterium talmoniae]OHV06910.1 NADH:flavin oxidoreductase [Mycobacterium talmoniae]PQM47985.1 NADH oxidase [Mycobacterium talmoniae]
MSAYQHVLSPMAIGPVQLRNRVVRTSQGSGLAVDQLVSDDMIAFLLARAQGGVALAFADVAQIHWSSPAMLDLSNDRALPGLTKLTTAVHAKGMRLFQQIWHGGPTQLTLDSSAPWAASHVPDPGLGMLPIPMTRPMMDELTESFVGAALRAREGGIDGIELHAGHGYLFSSFLSPATNLRNDDYGGPLENRARYLVEVLGEVRAAVGPDYPVGLRISPDGPEDQTTPSDLIALISMLERDRVIDFVDVSLGSHYARDLLIGGAHLAPGYMLPISERMTRATSLPTIVAGRITTLQQADQLVASGVADLVSMVRATLAEPELITKTVSGRSTEIRPCIACLQSCAGGLNTRGRAMCTINPASGRELTHGDAAISRHAPGLRVVVVGGGPAGLEAARSAAIAGHRVTLLEADDTLGGQLRLVPSTRPEVAGLLAFYANEMQLHAVDVRLRTRADAQAVRGLVPDAVVVATGITPRRDGFQTLRPSLPLPGIDQVAVHTGCDVLHGANLGHTVLLLDEIGHYESIDVAQRLIDTGHRVLMVSRYALVAANLEMRWEMIGSPLLAKLLQGDFTFFPRTVLHRLTPGSAEVAPFEAPHRMQEVAFDDVVLMSGGIPDRELQQELAGTCPVVRVIGDANSPRRLEIAIVEGRQSVDSLHSEWVRPGARYGWGGSAT